MGASFHPILVTKFPLMGCHFRVLYVTTESRPHQIVIDPFILSWGIAVNVFRLRTVTATLKWELVATYECATMRSEPPIYYRRAVRKDLGRAS